MDLKWLYVLFYWTYKEKYNQPEYHISYLFRNRLQYNENQKTLELRVSVPQLCAHVLEVLLLLIDEDQSYGVPNGAMFRPGNLREDVSGSSYWVHFLVGPYLWNCNQVPPRDLFTNREAFPASWLQGEVVRLF